MDTIENRTLSNASACSMSSGLFASNYASSGGSFYGPSALTVCLVKLHLPS